MTNSDALDLVWAISFAGLTLEEMFVVPLSTRLYIISYLNHIGFRDLPIPKGLTYVQ